MKCDFHIHTRFSDGGMNVDDVVQIAIKNKIKIIAITDHNNFEGLKYLSDKKFNNLKIIPGIEISTIYKKKSYHMLLYGFNMNCKIIKKYDNFIRQREVRKFKQMIKQVQSKFNIKFNKEVVSNFIKNNNYFDKTRLNDLIVISGFCDTPRNAYYKYTKDIKENIKLSISIKKAFNIEKKSKGVLSLAHPFKYSNNFENIKDLIKNLKNKYNLRAVEAINNHQSIEETKMLIRFCKKNKIFISGGSDYHAKFGEIEKKKIGYVNNKSLNSENLSFLTFMKEKYMNEI